MKYVWYYGLADYDASSFANYQNWISTYAVCLFAQLVDGSQVAHLGYCNLRSTFLVDSHFQPSSES